MDNVEKYQKQLLEQTQSLYRETPISEATQRAYLATPRHWIEVGVPTAACLNLKVFPIGAQVRTGDNQWLVKRKDSQFLWSLQP
jgi:hypothetical protein